MHHRREDFPRFRDGRIGRQKKKGQKYHFDRQLQEDLSYAREERQEPRRDYRRGGPRHIPSGVELWNRITVSYKEATDKI